MFCSEYCLLEGVGMEKCTLLERDYHCGKSSRVLIYIFYAKATLVIRIFHKHNKQITDKQKGYSSLSLSHHWHQTFSHSLP